MTMIKKALDTKNIVINEHLITIAIKKQLSLKEFLVLTYLYNDFNNVFDVETISKNLKLPTNEIMEAFNNLMLKNLVSLESIKDLESRYNEIVNLDGLFKEIEQNIKDITKEETKTDIFKTFETELGRTISPMELELINGWLASGTKEELILGALKEAIYNGVSNFRYIDKIIYEWEKKGFKTMADVNKHLKSRRENKDKDITKKEHDILAYDWINEE